MPPLPAFAPFVRRVVLAQHRLTLFLYDTHPDDHDDVPLLLVHGLGDEADTWQHLLPMLAAKRRVLAVDLPGFGRSDKPNAPYTVPWYAAVLCGLLDTLQLERVALVGHSLGAMTSQWLALEQAARVEGLALLAGGLAAAPRRLDWNTLLLLTPGIGEWVYTQLRKNPQAAYDSLRPFYADLDALPQSERDFLYQRVNERVWNDDQRRAFFRSLRARWRAGCLRSKSRWRIAWPGLRRPPSFCGAKMIMSPAWRMAVCWRRFSPQRTSLSYLALGTIFTRSSQT